MEVVDLEHRPRNVHTRRHDVYMGRLLTFDRSPGCVVVECQCGYRSVRVTLEAARAAGDAHRTRDHPRQATFVASKRRARGTVTT